VTNLDKKLTIVGLGPGSLEYVSMGTMDKLKSASKILLRTGKHPVVEDLIRLGLQFETFDALYELFDDFGKIYAEIAAAVIREAERGPVVFAVPGHPLVGEQSVVQVVKLAEKIGIAYDILPAMSFLDPVLTCLGVDLSEGLKVIDGAGLLQAKPDPGSRPDPRVPNLVMQVYSNLVASDIKLTLMDFYPDEHKIKVVRAAGVPEQERVQQVSLYELDRLDWIDHLTCVFIPPNEQSKPMVSMFPLDPIVELMDRLRGSDGCPWDREQTHQSLKKHLVEETYEVLDAIDEGNMYKVCEELGDLLLQIAFHAQVARESGFFDMNDVVEVISQKLVRRHPHVFGSVTVCNSEEVSINWEKIKKEELEEKGETRQSLLDGIPESMPALIKADKIQRKAAKVGFDWPDYIGALDKVLEEIAETREVILENNPERIQEEIGDLLFAVVNLSRLLQVNSDEALLAAIRKFKERFKYMEEQAAKSHTHLDKMDFETLDRLWEEAKNSLNLQKNKEFVRNN